MLRTETIFYFFLLFSFCSTLVAQESDVLMTNSRPVDANRYKGVQGEPYYFEDWQNGKIITVDANTIENLQLNFNGETKGFEVKKGDRFIELNPKWYIRILIENPDETTPIIFQKNFLPPLANQFTKVVYQGKAISVLEEFTSKIENKVFNDVGKNREFKRFYSRRNYYLMKEGKLSRFQLKKKSIIPLLGKKSELEKFLKKEKIKLNSEAALLKLLSYYESL